VMPFSFRVKFGQYEIELSGTREEVMRTVQELPDLIANVSKAFDFAKVGMTASEPVASVSAYPSISSSSSCSEAILRLLDTDWGMQPRTLPELEEVLKANAVHYPATTLSGVLAWLVRKNKIKRWKTDKGYVYVLARKEA